MAIFSGPSIVDNGLVLHLDAANPRSYPGTGTAWNDLSGNGNNGTNSNMTYSSTTGGIFYFNNSSSVSLIPDSPSLNPTTGLTIESWVKFDGNSDDFIFEKGNVNSQYSLFSHSTDVVFRTYHTDGLHTQNPLKSTVGVINGQWHHIVGSWDGTTKRIYIDGILKDSTARSNNLVTQTTGASVGRFGGTSTGYYFGGFVPKVAIYSRGITAAEIKQNFEATRSRYGI